MKNAVLPIGQQLLLSRGGANVFEDGNPAFDVHLTVPFDRAGKIVTIAGKERKSAMMIELPEDLGAALKAEANAHGVSADGYARGLLKRDLAPSLETQSSGVPFKTGRGMFAKYGQAPSAEEIDANRADMFRNFGEDF
jgi:plasmid stability protein